MNITKIHLKLLLSFFHLVLQPEYCAQMLDTLVSDAEIKVVNLMAAVLNGSSAGNNVSSLHQKVIICFNYILHCLKMLVYHKQVKFFFLKH